MVDEKKYLTVSAINRYIAYKIDSDIALKSLYVKGELSNVRESKGHIYLVIKDSESEIAGIIFYNVASKMKFMPKDGMKVFVHGSINTYSKKGTYNLIIDQIEECGEGLIYQEFLKLKEKLTKEGLFDDIHKKKIPEFCFNIGVITSQTADALFDIVSTISKRFPLMTIKVYPSLVQGSDAPQSLINSLISADSYNHDCLIIARGGGSFEDLNCFNDEQLARTIFNLKTPIVSGVGHEQDYTITDFVVDLRAPTPTGAATLITKEKNELISNINLLINKINSSIKKVVNDKNVEYNEIVNSYGFRNFDNILDLKINYLDLLIKKLDNNSPVNKLNLLENTVDSLNKRLEVYNIIDKINVEYKKVTELSDKANSIINLKINNNEKELDRIIEKMIDVNPLNIMKKGYSIVYNKNDELIISKDSVMKNDELKIQFSDGEVKVKAI